MARCVLRKVRLDNMYLGISHTEEAGYSDILENGQHTVTASKWLILCHFNQLNFTKDREIWTSEKCHCNQMALYCVTVTSVTVIN